MKVETIDLRLKYSKQLRDGEWKAIELEMGGSVDPKETTRQARQALQSIVATELRLAWAESMRGKSVPAQAQDAVGDEEIEELPQPARRAKKVDPLVKAALEMGGEVGQPADPSWCAAHEAKMKMRSWGGYSHKVGDKWCQGHWCSIHDVPLYKNEDKDGSVWFTHAHEDPDTGERVWCRGEGQPSLTPAEECPEEEIPF